MCSMQSKYLSNSLFIEVSYFLSILGITLKGRYATWLAIARPSATLQSSSRWSSPFRSADAKKNMFLLCPKVVTFFVLTPLLLLLNTVEIKGQEAPIWQEELTELFDEGDSIYWVKKFIGSKNNLFTFQIYLASNGDYVRGWYCYDGSKDTLRLEGMLDGKTLYLEEWYTKGQDCGFFKGEFDGSRFQGIWAGSTVAESMTCIFGERGSDIPPKSNPVFLNFKTDHPRWIAKWQVYTDYLYCFQGVVVTQDKSFYQLKLIDIKENEEGTLIYSVVLLDKYFNPAVKMKLNLKNNTGQVLSQEWESFQIKSNKVVLESSQQQEADFHQLKMIYQLPALDRQSSQLLIFSDTSCNLYERKRYQPDQRAGIYSTAMFYPTFASKQQVSALFSVNTARENKNCIDQKSINWVNKSKGLIDLTTDILDKTTWDREVNQFVDLHLEQIKSNKGNEPAWQQLKRKDFKHILLSDAGIVLAKDYDPVLGILFIPVPKEMVLYHFDKKSQVYKITNAKI